MTVTRVAPGLGLVLPRKLADELAAHALGAFPNEACGFLSGSLALGRADAFHAARNALASPWRYSVDADDLVRITLALDAAARDVVAVFHSHPTSRAVPSAADLRQATYPDAWYLIHGRADGACELRAWRIRDGRAMEAALIVA